MNGKKKPARVRERSGMMPELAPVCGVGRCCDRIPSAKAKASIPFSSVAALWPVDVTMLASGPSGSVLYIVTFPSPFLPPK